MKGKWNRYVKPKKLTSAERAKKAWLHILHQNDFEKIDYEPVDINGLFRSDGMIHVYR